MNRYARLAALIALATAAILVSPGTADGQILWDAPRMIGPESPSGVGFYWLRAEALPADGDAVFATLPVPGTDGGVTLRGGIGEGATDELAGFGGVDVRALIARHDESQPLDIGWNAGVGASYGEYLVVSVPVGLSAGRSWASGSVWFAPWVGLGAVLDYRRGDAAPEEEFALEPNAEVGLDLALDRSRRFVLRAAASLGDRQAVAVGLSIGGAR